MATDTTGIEYYTIPSFHFTNGAVLEIKVAYRSFNPSSTSGTVLIPTCFGGRINDTHTFANGALQKYHVVVVAMLGNGESSSPSNHSEFPKGDALRYQDCINAQYALVTEHLKVSHLEAVIGFSMAGQQAYYWAAMHGTGSSPFIKRAVSICSSAKTSDLNYTFLEGPITALTASHDYANGKYKANGVKPCDGLHAFSRAYAAWLSSADWFRNREWKATGAKSLKEWLVAGDESYESWDPEDLIALARMWQAGDIGAVAGSGDYRKALEEIDIPVLVMPGSTDQYFVWQESEEEVKELKHGTLAVIESSWGHMAGGGGQEDAAKFMDDEIKKFWKN